MNKKKIRTTLLILILLLGLSVGYAAISSTLNITGTSLIGNPTWNIHFENIQVKSGSVTPTTAASINAAGDTVTYAVTLAEPGDYYEFTVDAKNSGSIDGMISSITSKMNGSVITTLPEYLEYSVTYNSGGIPSANHLLAVNSTEKYKIHVGFKSDITQSQLPTTTQTLTFSYSVNYVQANENAVGLEKSFSIKETGGSSPIIHGTYTYTDPMTWQQFVNSAYNTEGWTIGRTNWSPGSTSDYIIIRINQEPYHLLKSDGTFVKATDTIIANHEYRVDDYICCFEPTTLIQTDLAGHTKMIKDFEVGDSIVVQSTITGEKYVTTVLKEASEHPETYDITVVTLDNGKTLRFNSYHPIYTVDGYKSVTNYNDYPTLTEDDIVILNDGSELPIKKIDRFGVEKPEITYNLLIKGINEYYLEEEFGYFANGVLVHTGIAEYDDEDEWRENNRYKCENVSLYKDFNYDEATDEEIVNFLANLKVTNENAFNEYIKFYMTADQYIRYAGLAKKVKARIADLEINGKRITYKGTNHYESFN